MEKKKIETFIKKYSLGGTIDSVIWTNDKEDLTVTAITSDKRLFASVQLEKGAVNFIDGVEVGVLNTERLKKMLIPLADNIALSLDIDDADKTRVRQIQAEDVNININYVTSETSAIDGVPSMKNVPPFEVEIILDEVFINAFNKSFAALGDDGALFTLIMNKKKKKLDLVLGYRQNLSDRIAIGVNTVTGKDAIKNPLSFTAKSLKEIISANSEVKDAVLKISDAGLASVSYQQDGFKSQYYLIKVEVED